MMNSIDRNISDNFDNSSRNSFWDSDNASISSSRRDELNSDIGDKLESEIQLLMLSGYSRDEAVNYLLMKKAGSRNSNLQPPQSPNVYFCHITSIYLYK